MIADTVCDGEKVSGYATLHLSLAGRLSIIIPPQTVFVGGILFSCCPSVFPSVSEIFLYLFNRQ